MTIETPTAPGVVLRAEPGTYVRVGLSRRRGRFTNKDHIATVDHHYGPRKNLTWVNRPLCGIDAGRGDPSWTDELCGTCARIAIAKGIEVA